MGDYNSTPSSSPPPTMVPTAFGVELTVPPSGTVSFNIRVTEDMILDGITAESSGPAVLTLRVGEPPEPGAPAVETPGGTFTDYLAHELPAHLAAESGETLDAWQAKNAQLREAALGGADEAFLELLARDPRELATELTVRRVLTWRSQIARHVRFYRFKPSRVAGSAAEVADVARQAGQARRHLRRLSESLLRAYDLRGHRPLPSPGLVQGAYYGLRCLLQGLRAVARRQQRAKTPSPRIERRLTRFVADLTRLQGPSPFLPCVAHAAELLTDSTVLTRAGLAGRTPFSLVGPRWPTTAQLAQTLTAAAFEVSPDTVERLCARPVLIPLSQTDGGWAVFIGRPAFALLELPEVKPLLATLTR
jgi:hypothetical protein